MGFEWDEAKARSNVIKHGVTFEEAAQVFYDTLSRTSDDPAHSDDEDRFIMIGMSFRQRLLFVSYTENENQLRIISAREATKQERKLYEN